MEFAVVRFLDENAPGVVCINWINRRKGTCWFPNVRSEMKKKKLLLKKATPGNSWLECPIKVLKEFASYESARIYMIEVEENSNSESASELNSSRKRQKTSICLSDEDSCSEETEDISRKKSKNYPAFKFHPSFFTEPSCNTKLPQNQYQVTFSLPVPPPAMRVDSMENTGNSCGSDSELSENRTTSSNQDYLNPSNNQGITCDIEQLKTNQTNICNTLAELLNRIKRIESKVDLLLESSRGLSSSVEPVHDVEDMSLISSMPVGIEDFHKLNERIVKSPSFKERLILILKTSGGRDTKALVCNILRKLITDDVGIKFSLTGKNLKGGMMKQPFEKTAAYKLLLEVCFLSFGEAKENTVREAVSDWLMQSKFRKNRREKRMTTSQPNISFIQALKAENTCSDDE